MNTLMLSTWSVIVGVAHPLATSAAMASVSSTINKNNCGPGSTVPGCGSGSSGLPVFLTGLVDGFIYVGAALSIVFILVGAVRYITSTGDSKRIQTAKDTIMYAVIGLVAMILARAIVGFVIQGVG